jgi:hypothetical protein
VNFLDLPLKSRRAAFAKMDAADKAPKAKAPRNAVKKSASRKLGSGATAKKTAAKRTTKIPAGKTGQVPLSSMKSGKYSDAEITTLVNNFRAMHGKDPSPAQLAKLSRKRR